MEKFNRVNLKVENDYEIESLTRDKLTMVEALNAKCSDYYLLHEGVLPSEREALEIFIVLPPGKDYEDKFVLGIFKGGTELIGIVDIVKDFPAEREWMLGLLLLDPEERGKRLGKLVHKALVQWAAGLGARCFRIGVIEDNYKGKKFWTDLGYVKIERGAMNVAKKKHMISVMTLQIRSGQR